MISSDGDVNYSVDNKTIRTSENQYKAMRLVIDEKDREILHLM